MLEGYSLPLTPGGLSSLVPPPPWHFSGEMLVVTYRLDPEVARSFLPDVPGLLPAADGSAAVVFGDWQSCRADGRELLDPVSSQYKESYVVLGCELYGRCLGRAAFTWVDKDFSLIRGLIQGYPKKLGSIAMTRAMGVGLATARVAPGGTFAASLAAVDRRRIDMKVSLREPAVAPALVTAPLLHTRRFPSWDPTLGPLTEHVLSASVDQVVDHVWAGDGDLTIFDAPDDELSLLGPAEITGAYRLEFAETLTGGQIVSPDAHPEG